MTQYAAFKFKCDNCGRRMGDIGLFLMEHIPPDSDYCFDCVKPRPLGKKKESPLILRENPEAII